MPGSVPHSSIIRGENIEEGCGHEKQLYIKGQEGGQKRHFREHPARKSFFFLPSFSISSFFCLSPFSGWKTKGPCSHFSFSLWAVFCIVLRTSIHVPASLLSLWRVERARGARPHAHGHRTRGKRWPFFGGKCTPAEDTRHPARIPSSLYLLCSCVGCFPLSLGSLLSVKKKGK